MILECARKKIKEVTRKFILFHQVSRGSASLEPLLMAGYSYCEWSSQRQLINRLCAFFHTLDLRISEILNLGDNGCMRLLAVNV